MGKPDLLDGANWLVSEWAPSGESPSRLARRHATHLRPRMSVGDRHLLKQIDGAVHLGHVPQHVPAVYMNRAGGCRIEQEVGGHGLVGAIEQKAHQLALSVKRRRTGISSRGIHGRQEVDWNVPE